MQYAHFTFLNGEVDKAALILEREEIETILHALNIAGASFSDNALSAVYDDLHDKIERMVFEND